MMKNTELYTYATLHSSWWRTLSFTLMPHCIHHDEEHWALRLCHIAFTMMKKTELLTYATLRLSWSRTLSFTLILHWVYHDEEHWASQLLHSAQHDEEYSELHTRIWGIWHTGNVVTIIIKMKMRQQGTYFNSLQEPHQQALLRCLTAGLCAELHQVLHDGWKNRANIIVATTPRKQGVDWDADSGVSWCMHNHKSFSPCSHICDKSTQE